jgi:integrase
MSRANGRRDADILLAIALASGATLTDAAAQVGISLSTAKRRAAEAWLAAQTQLRPRTRELYRMHLKNHVYPSLGRVWVHQIREDDLTALIGEMREAGLSGYTAKGVLTPLGRVLNSAVRKRILASNPMSRLERGERPAVERREMRTLDTAEVGKLLDACGDTHRTLIATAVFTGLRQGEVLGLTWADVNLDAGIITVRKQLDRHGQRVAPKTVHARRDVELFPALVKMLRGHREGAFARGQAKPDDFVFASAAGTPLHYRNVVRRGLDPAAEKAKLIPTAKERKAAKARGEDGRTGLRWHDLRHTYASLLILQGANVVYVSRMLGHASPTITLTVYSHLLDRAEHATRMRDGMEAAFGNAAETTGGKTRRQSGAADASNVALLHRSSTGGD